MVELVKKVANPSKLGMRSTFMLIAKWTSIHACKEGVSVREESRCPAYRLVRKMSIWRHKMFKDRETYTAVEM